ncbi:PPR repeat-containing protein [Cladophialophora immunda]|nr:PPR repeat-containing protein [Cladophialophora immunda]
MIERTAACIEPASQLFLRRLEPPVRTHRALGPSFWKNGGNQLDVPPWWPLYLNSIRALRPNPPGLESVLPCPRQSWVVEPSETPHRSRVVASRSDRYSARLPPSSTRAYTRSAKSTQKATAVSVKEEEHLEDVLLHYPPSHLPERITVDDTRKKDNDPVTAGAHEELWNEDPIPTVNRTEKQLLQILDNNRDVQPESESADFDRAWALFNQVPNQQAYAPEIFQFLSKSSRRRDQTLALSAFRLIDEEHRTRDDYERAVRSALKADNYRLALRINARATLRNLQQGCSVFLLLHAVSNQLWNTAATVWDTSFKRLPFRAGQTSPTRLAITEEIGNYRDLPFAIHQLGTKLRERAVVTMRHSGSLLTLFNELLNALVRNGSLMSIITPQGLEHLFQLSNDLSLSKPSLYITAIDTINKLAMRPDKGTLADLVYNLLRSSLPEVPPRPQIFGSLLSIHCNEGAPAETYNHYLDEFSKFHGVADLKSYQKVLSALAAQGDVDGIQQAFLRLCETHSRPTDVAYYTPLLYAFARLGDVQGTEREFRRMTDFGVRPNSYCWNILLYAHSRSLEPWRTFEVLDRMKAEGVAPDAFTFTTLMGVFSRTGDTDTVLDILEQAQQHKVQGSYGLVTGLIQTYCLNNQAEAAERLAEAATNAHLQGSPVTMWNYLLRHYAFTADSDSMLRVQGRMSALGVEPDAMTHAAFMTALVVLNKTRDAVQILRTLSLSQTLAATPFHYAIILHGFAKEGDRDMANIVYQEMIERFPRIGASPRLAMLHLQASRNSIPNERPLFAAQYLEEILHELSTQDRAERQPQPGLHRRRGVDAVPSVYLEYLIDLLAARGQIKHAEKLVQRFESLSQSSYLILSNAASTSIQFLTRRLMISSERYDWETVDSTWKQILERGIQTARRFSRTARKQLPRESRAVDGERTRPVRPTGLPDSELITKEDFSFESMIPYNTPISGLLDEPGLVILPSQRYILEAPLTRYLNSLSVRQLQSRAIALVAELERVGFALTSKNWNMYIQTLTLSKEQQHWLLAYEVFEQKMIANTPPWSVLRRGKWLSSKVSEGSHPTLVPRKIIEKRDPGQMMPTYYTAVHLASVLLKANRLAAEGDKATYMALRKVAPQTCRFVQSMPYHRDRIQGVLLRGRKIRADPPKQPREFAEPDRSGVLGSKSPADHIPATEVVGIEDAVRREAGDKKSFSAVAEAREIRQAELYEGEIARVPGATEKQQDQEAKEINRRVRHKERKLLQILEKVRRDVLLPRKISDPYIGHPTISVGERLIRTRSGGQGLYNPTDRRLEQSAQTKKEVRERCR